MIDALAPLAHDFLTQPDEPARLEALVQFLTGLDPTRLPLDEAWSALGQDAWRGLALATDPLGRFDLSLFVIGPNAAIPIHDHPGMTVLTRVAAGRLTLQCWDAPGSTAHTELTLGPDDPPHLTLPDRANLHRLEPVGEAGCAFMDLFLPDYGEGRRCSYYAVEPAGPGGREALRRLG